MRNDLDFVKNFIFDMDGTLVNSSEEVLSCLQSACEKFGAVINFDKFNPNVIGPPLKDIIREIIVDDKNDNLINSINAEFRRIYDNDENDMSYMYENTYEWLYSLKKSEKKLFLATNKPTIPTIRLIKKFNLGNMFEEFYTIDKHGESPLSKSQMISEILEKFNLEKSHTVMIGDAPSDINAAHTAGISAIAALWGYGHHEKVLKEISEFTMELKDLVKL